MITVAQYFGSHTHTADDTQKAYDLLKRVNELIEHYEESGGRIQKNPRTESYISGVTFGGFRPQDCPQGAPNSAHKTAQAVDIFDPDNLLDNWITDIILLKFDLYREHPSQTKFWCHLGSKPPKSGKRTFHP